MTCRSCRRSTSTKKALEERDDWQVMTQKEIENLKSKAMVFNAPDPKPFQEALRKPISTKK
jgi:hypothetical protein